METSILAVHCVHSGAAPDIYYSLSMCSRSLRSCTILSSSLFVPYLTGTYAVGHKVHQPVSQSNVESEDACSPFWINGRVLSTLNACVPLALPGSRWKRQNDNNHELDGLQFSIITWHIRLQHSFIVCLSSFLYQLHSPSLLSEKGS
jgi:hypothetical protein